MSNTFTRNGDFCVLNSDQLALDARMVTEFELACGEIAAGKPAPQDKVDLLLKAAEKLPALRREHWQDEFKRVGFGKAK